MNQLSLTDFLMPGIDAAAHSLDSDDGTGLRIQTFDTAAMDDPTGSGFTWICLIDVAFGPVA